MPTYHPDHAATVATIGTARLAAREALHAEMMERTAHTERGPDHLWEWRNDTKWAAYDTVTDLIPGVDGDTDEETLLAVCRTVNQSTDHALARKWGLPW